MVRRNGRAGDWSRVTAPRAGIAAIASAVPDREVTNDELAREHPDWRMSVVARRTGVLSRRWCAPDETSLDLAVKATASLFQRVDMVLSAPTLEGVGADPTAPFTWNLTSWRRK